MLFAVWILFFVMWAPYLIFNTIVSYWGSMHIAMTGEEATIMAQSFVLLSMSNSALNPLMYAFMSRYGAVSQAVHCTLRLHVLVPLLFQSCTSASKLHSEVPIQGLVTVRLNVLESLWILTDVLVHIDLRCLRIGLSLRLYACNCCTCASKVLNVWICIICNSILLLCIFLALCLRIHASAHVFSWVLAAGDAHVCFIIASVRMRMPVCLMQQAVPARLLPDFLLHSIHQAALRHAHYDVITGHRK